MSSAVKSWCAKKDGVLAMSLYKLIQKNTACAAPVDNPVAGLSLDGPHSNASGTATADKIIAHLYDSMNYVGECQMEKGTPIFDPRMPIPSPEMAGKSAAMRGYASRHKAGNSEQLKCCPLHDLFGQQCDHGKLCELFRDCEGRPFHCADDEKKWLVEQLRVDKVLGGNSNHVYRLSNAEFPDSPLLLRVYGDSSGVINRILDITATRWMSDAGLAPTIFHSFPWGRVEQFLDDAITCTTTMLKENKKLLGKVFSSIRGMHELDLMAFRREVTQETLREAQATGSKKGDSASSLVLESDANMDLVAQVLESTCISAFEVCSLRMMRLSCPFIREELRDAFRIESIQEIYYMHHLLHHYVASPVVFAHNDVNPGNVLLSKTTESPSRAFKRDELDRYRIVLIDFEYTDANYRCIDLGNTLNEIDYDYTEGQESGGGGFGKPLFANPPASYAEESAQHDRYYPRLPAIIFEAWKHQKHMYERQQQNSPMDEAAQATIPEHIAEGLGPSILAAIAKYFKGNEEICILPKWPTGELEFGPRKPRNKQCPCWFRHGPTRGYTDSLASSQCALLTLGSERDELLPLSLLVEVFIGMLASHLYWSFWSIVCGCNGADGGGVEFNIGSSGLDYIKYGECRLREYFALKQWIIEQGLIPTELFKYP